MQRRRGDRGVQRCPSLQQRFVHAVEAFAEIPTRGSELSAGLLRNQDLVLIATDHDAFDYALVLKNASLIVDTRVRSIREVLDVVLDTCAVADISVVDPPLEDVIAQIYEKATT